VRGKKTESKRPRENERTRTNPLCYPETCLPFLGPHHLTSPPGWPWTSPTRSRLAKLAERPRAIQWYWEGGVAVVKPVAVRLPSNVSAWCAATLWEANIDANCCDIASLSATCWWRARNGLDIHAAGPCVRW
jgi:hypothetical protein